MGSQEKEATGAKTESSGPVPKIPGPWNGMSDSELRGLGVSAMKILLTTHVRNKSGERMGWRYVREGLAFAERWMKANGGGIGSGKPVGDFAAVMGELNMMLMPLKELDKAVVGSLLVSKERVEEIHTLKGSYDNDLEVEFGVTMVYGGKEGESNVSPFPGHIAVHGEGTEERIAIVNWMDCCVNIYNVESGKCIMTVGSPGTEPGKFEDPFDAAFNSKGELFVSDKRLSTIQVFNSQGAYVRTIGRPGDGEGQFDMPSGIAFTPDGQLVVVDYGNHRVQILNENGSFVRSFGEPGTENGKFHCPQAVCVSWDGMIHVADSSNHRVQVHDKVGKYVRSIRIADASDDDDDKDLKDLKGKFRHPLRLAVGKSGEVVVSCQGQHDILVLDSRGGLLQVIGPRGHSRAELNLPTGVAIDSQGRMFVSASGRIVMLS